MSLPRTRLGGGLLVCFILAGIGWISDQAVDAVVEQHGWGMIQADELHLLCALPGTGVVLLGPVWLYRILKSRLSKRN